MKAEKTQTEQKVYFKSFNKKLNEISVPIIMNDINRLEELKELREKFEEKEEIYKEYELSDYIGILKEFNDTFCERIGNNLNQTKYKEKTKDILNELISKIVIIGDCTQDIAKYNCHGWSLGQVKWCDLKATQVNFIPQVNMDKELGQITSTVYDSTQINFFSLKYSQLVQKEGISKINGSVVAYYNDDKVLTHTSRYITSIDWYKYDNNLHSEWYSKKQQLIEFDEETGQCFINNYTSKLGMGYNVVHEINDLAPLYGEIIEYHDLVS